MILILSVLWHYVSHRIRFVICVKFLGSIFVIVCCLVRHTYSYIKILIFL